jgi:thiol:disulfide interchange protein DsbC
MKGGDKKVRKLILFFFLFPFVLPTQNSYAFSAKGQDCSKCHTIKKEEAATMLRKFDENIRVLAVNKSQVKYLWEVSYESKGKKGVIYIDLPKKHLFTGSLIDIKDKNNLTQDSLSELNKVDVSQVPLKDALVLGDKKAKHKVIVFNDPE